MDEEFQKIILNIKTLNDYHYYESLLRERGKMLELDEKREKFGLDENYVLYAFLEDNSWKQYKFKFTPTKEKFVVDHYIEYPAGINVKGSYHTHFDAIHKVLTFYDDCFDKGEALYQHWLLQQQKLFKNVS